MTGHPHPAALAWASSCLADESLAADRAWGGDQTVTYRLSRGETAFAYLKIGGDELIGEEQRLCWLGERLPAPEVLGLGGTDAERWLLTRALAGADLSQPVHTAKPQRLVRLLAAALRQIHALSPADCLFPHPTAPGTVVVHGDACLPNFVSDGRGLTGYLDVGDLGRGEPEVDLAAVVWSLDYNLGPGFGADFLRAYGWPADAQTLAALKRRYEGSSEPLAPSADCSSI